MKIIKNILFYLLSFTWGILMTLIGGVAILALIITGHKPKLFNGRCYVQVGDYWGGVDLGCFFITDKDVSLNTKQHECGHGIQNIILGPLMPFVVCIPSATRYWLQEIKTWKNRVIFITLLLLAIDVLGFVFLIPGLLLNILVLSIIGGLILFYMLILFIWLAFFELPQYRYSVPDYYDVWFERTASEWGAKLFPEDIK